MKVFLKFILAFVVLGISTIVNAQTGKDDYSLEELVDAALQNHQLLKIKKLQVAEQETKLREANIRYYPVVNLNAGYQYNFNIGLLTVPAGSFGILPLYYPTGVVNLPLPDKDGKFELGEHNAYNAGVVVYQPVSQLFKIGTAVKVAEKEISIANAAYSQASFQIKNGVEKLYYGILALRKRKSELEKNKEVAELKLYDVQTALLAGKTIEVNEAGLRANIADKEQELLKLRFQEEDLLADLRKLTGITEENIFLQEHRTVEEIKSLEEYLQAAQSGNTDILLAGMQKQKAELGVKASRQSFVPEVGLIGSYTYQKGNKIFPEHNPFIGANLKWNITELFSNKENVSRSILLQRQAEENESFTRIQVKAAIETAYRKLIQARELIKVTEKLVDYRKQELIVEQDRMAAGLSTQIKVLETEASLAKAEADLYGAIQSFNIAKSELHLLTGYKK